MALTTTTGFCDDRPLTIAATRSIARASSTDVPPNFITIMGVASWQDYESANPRSFRVTIVEIALGLEQFGIQHGRAGGAPNGVVREHGKFPIQHAARPQMPNRRCHARAHINVKARLRTVIRLQVNHGTLRRTGQLQ